MSNVVELEGLEMTYSRVVDSGSETVERIRVFSDLDFSFEEAKSYAITGASGVGKTTLLHLLGGLDMPTSGDVKVLGSSLPSLMQSSDQISKFRRSHIGFVFQFHHLLPEFDALENVAMPLLINGCSQAESNTRARELLSELGLSERLNHRPSMLSGGEQQRVAIARALINRPELVLADEPTGNLDQKTAESVLSVLQNISSEYGTTLLVVTHSMALAERLDVMLELSSKGLTFK